MKNIFNKPRCGFFLSFLFLAGQLGYGQSHLFQTQAGQVHFKSDAPLEVIEATSQKLKGIINIKENTFAFTIPIRSFQGFNSPLQQEHFNENYMESQKFPDAVFTGRIIEKVDLTVPGTYSIRAKGTLTIHGIGQERIIKSTVKVNNKTLFIHSFFTVLLKEHDITIPRIVYQKIAEEIEVNIDGEMGHRFLNKAN